MNKKFGSITWEQVVSHIENNYLILHPIQGRLNVKLRDYQKYLIKQILNGNTITMQARQLGVSSVYILVTQTLCQLIPNLSILYLTHKLSTSQWMRNRLNLNLQDRLNIKINNKRRVVFQNQSTIRFESYNSPCVGRGESLDVVFIDGVFTNFKEEVMKNLSHSLVSSGNMHIGFNKPPTWNYRFPLYYTWKDALIQDNTFKAIYLPWYVNDNRSQEFEQINRIKLGTQNFYREQLA